MVSARAAPPRLSAKDFLVQLSSRDEDVVEAANVQAQAFGDETPYPGQLRQLIAAGGLLAVARLEGRAPIVGSDAARPPLDGVTEIAGIAVLPECRRRGIATALSARLADASIRQGAGLAWLTPDTSEARRIYARAGFVCASELLHISKTLD